MAIIEGETKSIAGRKIKILLQKGYELYSEYRSDTPIL